MGYWDKRTPAQGGEETEEPEVTDLDGMEQVFNDEVDEIKQAFRDRMKAENKRFADVCDSAYWFCVCFKSRQQRAEFLEKIGLDPDLKYVDGKEMARAYKKEIESEDLKFPKIKPPDKDFSARTMQ